MLEKVFVGRNRGPSTPDLPAHEGTGVSSGSGTLYPLADKGFKMTDDVVQVLVYPITLTISESGFLFLECTDQYDILWAFVFVYQHMADAARVNQKGPRD